jgi:vancomycin permeability regulator SanA
VKEQEKEPKNWLLTLQRLVKKHKRTVIILLVVFLVLLMSPTIYTNLSTRNLRYNIAKTSVQTVPKKQVAIVLGAGVDSSGEPTPYLQWRVDTALKLYKAGRVQKILMSGDNSNSHYNEPVAMKKLAIKLGAKDSDVILDYAGYSTYDTCYRARYIFGVDNAVIVTQGYHLPRAVMTCNDLGIKAVGVAALRHGRDLTVTYILREWLSTNKAVLQLIAKPQPTVLGNPEPIKL